MNEKPQPPFVWCLSEREQGRQTRANGSTSLHTGENAMDPGVQTAEDLDQLAVTATRLAYRHRQKVTFNELLAIPAVFSEMEHVDVKNSPAVPPRSTHWDMVQDALQNWAPEGVRTNVLRRLVFTPQRYFGVNLSTDRQVVLQELRTAVTRHKIGLVVNMATTTLRPPATSTSECTAMLPSTMANAVKFRSQTCRVEVIATDPSAPAPSSSAGERAPPVRLEVAYQQWPRDELKPFLELWHASAAATHPARIVVLSIADGTPRKTHASRFTAKHVLSLAWATRNGVVAETMRRGPA